MAASEHLSPELFHGTGGAIKGGVVRPSEEGSFGPGAYATPYEDEAAKYASWKAEDEGRLFGTVYRVKPISSDPTVIKDSSDIFVVDQKGLRVVEPTSYPLNSKVAQRKW